MFWNETVSTDTKWSFLILTFDESTYIISMAEMSPMLRNPNIFACNNRPSFAKSIKEHFIVSFDFLFKNRIFIFVLFVPQWQILVVSTIIAIKHHLRGSTLGDFQQTQQKTMVIFLLYSRFKNTRGSLSFLLLLYNFMKIVTSM